MKNRILAWLLLVCMLVGLLPMQVLAAQVPSSLTEVAFDTASNEAVLNAGSAYKLSGSVTGKVIRVTDNANVTIVLEGVTMTAETSPIQVETGATLTLIVRDGTENTITCTAATADDTNNGMTAGISVPDGATLTIDAPDGGANSGKLTVTGGYGGVG